MCNSNAWASDKRQASDERRATSERRASDERATNWANNFSGIEKMHNSRKKSPILEIQKAKHIQILPELQILD